MKFCILGSGAWGTAMAIHLAKENHDVLLVPRRKDAADEMNRSRENAEYLPHSIIPEQIKISHEYSNALHAVDFIILAMPSKGVREALLHLKPLLPKAKNLKLLISLCKGLELKSKKTAGLIIEEILGSNVDWSILSGPSYAREVAEGRPTALVLGTNASEKIATMAQESLSSPLFRVYRTNDVIGVELGGCLKNVYAIGAGICEGLLLGDNAKAAYLTRALHEMNRLGCVLGGKSTTFYGLSGFGDLVATAQGKWSRNRSFGQKIAEGGNPQTLVDSSNSVVEGYWTTKAFYELAKEKNIDCPILGELYSVLFEEKISKECVPSLMSRDLKSENHLE